MLMWFTFKLYDKALRENVVEQNLKRLPFIPYLLIPLSLGHIIYFLISMPEPGTVEYTWRFGIILSHSVLIGVSLLAALLTLTRIKAIIKRYLVKQLFILAIIMLLLLTAASISIIDQLVTQAITPLIIASVAVSVLFLIHPLVSLILFGLNFLFFYFLLPVTQNNPEIILSNRVNAITAFALGFLVSYLFWKANHNKLIQQELIATQQKQLEQKNKELSKQAERLIELNATKDKFFSIIAHDLRSPFNSILGLSEMLAEHISEKQTDDLAKFSHLIRNTAKQTLDLLTNLLDWSSSQTDRIEFTPEYFSLSAVVIENVELLEEMARQKSIRIDLELDQNLVVFADKEMIRAVLRNLLSNAIKFTENGGQIKLNTNTDEKEWVLNVQDDGIGIEKTMQQKLFRIDETFSTKGTQNEKGTGLGLILCKEFIDKHNGKIWVESELGKGSTFGIALPNQV
jgi:signal transduction histidine kinase